IVDALTSNASAAAICATTRIRRRRGLGGADIDIAARDRAFLPIPGHDDNPGDSAGTMPETPPVIKARSAMAANARWSTVTTAAPWTPGGSSCLAAATSH